MKRLSTLLLALLTVSAIWGNPISKKTAQQIAEAFLNRTSGDSATPSNVKGFTGRVLKRVDSNTLDIDERLFLFNASDGKGFVIVSGDDRTAPVLGYSDTGRIDFKNMSQNMRSWLQHYAAQIEFIQNNNLSITDNTVATVGAPIPIQLDCTWGQDEIYNAQCPPAYIYDDEECTQLHKFPDPAFTNPLHTQTGCNATALAQILYAWKAEGLVATTNEIPAVTDRIHPEKDSYNQIAWTKYSDQAIPAGTPIDWENILPSYYVIDKDNNIEYFESTPEQKAAIANLMHICGAAMDTKYGIMESTAWAMANVHAAVNYLGFPNATACPQQCYPYQEWIQMLYDELGVAKAVFFSGFTPDYRGHSFVIDGYDSEDIFHVNWGWDGRANGFYRLNALNPSFKGTGGEITYYEFNDAQHFTRGLYPNAPATEPIVQVSEFYSKSKTVQNDNGIFELSEINIHLIDHSHIELDAEIGITIESNGVKNTNSFFSETMYQLEDIIREKAVCTLGELEDGEYIVYPSYRTSENEEWVPCMGYENNHIKVTVANGTASLENVLPYKLANVSSDNKAVYAVGEPINFTAKVKLVRGELHNLLATLIQPIDEMGDMGTEDEDVIFNDVFFYYVQEGETFDVEFSVPFELPEGMYMFSIVDASTSSEAYLHRVCMIEVKDGATAIHDVDAVLANSSDSPVYNIQGQQVDENYKGIIIQNGKKMVK